MAATVVEVAAPEILEGVETAGRGVEGVFARQAAKRAAEDAAEQAAGDVAERTAESAAEGTAKQGAKHEMGFVEGTVFGATLAGTQQLGAHSHPADEGSDKGDVTINLAPKPVTGSGPAARWHVAVVVALLLALIYLAYVAFKQSAASSAGCPHAGIWMLTGLAGGAVAVMATAWAQAAQ